MIIRKTLKEFDKGRDVTLLFSCSDAREAAGKYVVGLRAGEEAHLVIVFDESASFHRDIALRHRLRPRGGGWLELSARKKRIHLSGRSAVYGREPDRSLTARVLSIAFPEFTCGGES